jgi:hypothetical protein
LWSWQIRFVVLPKLALVLKRCIEKIDLRKQRELRLSDRWSSSEENTPRFLPKEVGSVSDYAASIRYANENCFARKTGLPLVIVEAKSGSCAAALHIRRRMRDGYDDCSGAIYDADGGLEE